MNSFCYKHKMYALNLYRWVWETGVSTGEWDLAGGRQGLHPKHELHIGSVASASLQLLRGGGP